MQKSYSLHFIKSMLFWRNLHLALQGLLKKSLLPSVIVLALKNGRFLSQGIVKGNALDLGSKDPSVQRTTWSLTLG